MKILIVKKPIPRINSLIPGQAEICKQDYPSVTAHNINNQKIIQMRLLYPSKLVELM